MSEPRAIPSDVEFVPLPAAPPREWPGLYLQLGKARLSALVVLTAIVGYLLGSAGRFSWLTFAATTIGTALLSCGANGLNQWMEAERDARMLRTRHRPIPSGRLTLGHGFVASCVMLLAGTLVLMLLTHPWTVLFGVLAAATYLIAYTPLKTRSTANTLVGAVSGALPPVMGWAAARGSLGIEALLLFGLLFLWQVPHFLALAWIYRDDYARGGYRMLPMIDTDGRITAMLAMVYALALVPIAFLMHLFDMGGTWFAFGGGGAALAFALLALSFLNRRSHKNARRLFVASLIYLPVTLGLLLADRPSDPDLRPVVVRLEQPR